MCQSRIVRLCLSFVLTLASAASLSASVFIVTTTADSGPGSLRQAVISANAAPGPHTIAFSIVGAGPHSIALATDLPSISVLAGLTIDGTTQSGFAGTPLIEVHRDGGSATCFQTLSTPTTIKALAINRCGSSAITSNGLGGGGLTLLGSYLGTDPSGTVAQPNGAGILLSGGTNTIGGSNAGDRNIISNNNNFAIQGGGTTTIRGNYIGVDVTGSVAMLNDAGINCGGTLVIGGSAAGEGNVISGSATHAIQPCATTVIQGNFIGTNAAGTAAIPNVTGIFAVSANNIQVGGPGPGEGNVIAGNTDAGLRLTSSNNATVQGNFFGTNVAGTAEIGNGTGIEVNSVGVLIGTATPGGAGANLIAFNHRGIVVNGSTTTIRGNSIRDNTLLGIDLGDNGVSRNDAGDGDGQQNFPNLISAVPDGAGVRIIGTLKSQGSAAFDLDFYESPGCSRFPQDLLQGPEWLGTAPVVTDGTGFAAFNYLLTPVTVAPDLRVSATATPVGGGGTSEFSQRIVLSSLPLTGDTAGSALQIQGMQFENGATVTVGGVAATNVQVVAPTFITAQAPALPAGSINDLVVTNPSTLSGTLPSAYVSLFADVESASGFRSFIGGLVANGLTVGCGGPNYCPLNPVTRQQMAVFLLRGKFGLCYTPPPCTGTVFDDVQCAGNNFAPWIEALAGLNITGGCGGNNYCPTLPVNRQQMAVFLLKAFEGSDYLPPACSTPVFNDVPCTNPFAPWINELDARSITGGCGGGNYCPTLSVIRQQMAVFLVKTFTLPF